MKTGFLIVNYNDVGTTTKLLENIKCYGILDLIVVVDNKSSDDSYEVLISKYGFSHIHIIQNDSNKGYASAINMGSKYLMKQLGDCNIIVSNSDIIIDDEKNIVDLIEDKRDDYAIVAPIIREHQGLNRGWKVPTPLQDVLLNLPYIHKYLRQNFLFYNNAHFSQNIVEVEAVSGCFFVIDSRYLELIDYFDENTFLYYEENIMAKKIRGVHKKVVINTQVEVFHNHSLSIDKSINHKRKYKILKDSQYYFQCEYNNANPIERLLLKATSKITYFLISIIKQKK